MVTTEQVAGKDFNLSPSRYVVGASETAGASLEDVIGALFRLEEQAREIDADLGRTLALLPVEVKSHVD